MHLFVVRRSIRIVRQHYNCFQTEFFFISSWFTSNLNKDLQRKAIFSLIFLKHVLHHQNATKHHFPRSGSLKIQVSNAAWLRGPAWIYLWGLQHAAFVPTDRNRPNKGHLSAVDCNTIPNHLSTPFNQKRISQVSYRHEFIAPSDFYLAQNKSHRRNTDARLYRCRFPALTIKSPSVVTNTLL